MDLSKLTAEELRQMSPADIRELEEKLREHMNKALLGAPLDKEGGENASKKSKLQRALARLLTIRAEVRIEPSAGSPTKETKESPSA